MKKIHVFLLIFPVLWACADVHMPNLFSDHMLLQRGLAVPVWGTAEPGEEILVRFASQ